MWKFTFAIEDEFGDEALTVVSIPGEDWQKDDCLADAHKKLKRRYGGERVLRSAVWADPNEFAALAYE
jgi:hypothetical protein